MAQVVSRILQYQLYAASSSALRACTCVCAPLSDRALLAGLFSASAVTSPAAQSSSGYCSARAYHGESSDDDSAQDGELRQHAKQLRQMRQVAQSLRGDGSSQHSISGVGCISQPHLPEHAARHAMRNPLGMLMAATGVPLGLSMKVTRPEEDGVPDGWSGQQQQQQQQHAAFSMQQQGGWEDGESAQPLGPGSAGEEAAAVAEAPAAAEQLGQLMAGAAAEADGWGTTRESAEQIAQRIADVNRGDGGGVGGGGGGGEGDGGDDDLILSAAEGRYASREALEGELRQLKVELAAMEEILDILAQVPWLNENDVDEKELRGVVSVGLLGTLEEVGWKLRPGIARIWAGERDGEVVAGDAGPREQAALAMVLQRTLAMEEQYGPPAAAFLLAPLHDAAGAAGGQGGRE